MPEVLRSLVGWIRKGYGHPSVWKKFWYLGMLATLVAAGSTAGLIFLVRAGVFGPIPGPEELERIKHPIASEVYSADSVLLGKYYWQDRSPVLASEIPKALKDALLAAEDARFYKHTGVDTKSLFRVFVKTILFRDKSSGGGSTLTQQLAKNLYPRQSHGFLSLPVNKIREFLIARRLEQVYSKDDILVLYLNTIPFADNTFGIKTASDRFFSKRVADLAVNEAAVLVGMLKATHYYNPRLFPDRALVRRNVVIAQMAKYGYIGAGEKEYFQSRPLGLKYNNTTYNEGIAPYFRATLQRVLMEWCARHKKEDGSAYNLYTDGLKIYTTIDSRMQRYAEQAMKAQMRALQEKFQGQLSRSTLEAVAKSKARQLDAYKSLQRQGLTEKQILEKLKTPLKTKVFTWSGQKDTTLSLYDSLKHHLQYLQAGVLAMDPASGAVRVWVGGIDHRFFQYDHVRETTRRQVGLALKPVLYAAAIESGIGPCDYISAQKTSYENMEGWTPANTHEDTYERKYSMEGGLSGSVNTVSVKLLEKTGIPRAIGVARKMGITSELPEVPSLALGTASISVMEMVGAYSVLANGGMYHTPYSLTSIADQQDHILEQFSAEEPSRALSGETAQLMVQMLKRVVTEGTGASLQSRYGVTNDVAGKTGTTQSNVDGWFIAMLPRLVVGAWVGADDPRLHFRSTTFGQGATTALPIVARFLVQADQDRSLRPVMRARFAPLSQDLLEQLDCQQSKSNLNIIERIFKRKKSVKMTRFKDSKDKSS